MLILGMVVVYFGSMVGAWMKIIDWGDWCIIGMLFFGLLAIIESLKRQKK